MMTAGGFLLPGPSLRNLTAVAYQALEILKGAVREAAKGRNLR
jgi:hypothetical protein